MGINLIYIFSVKLAKLTNELDIGRSGEGKREVLRMGLGSRVVPFSKIGEDKKKKQIIK